MTSAEDVVQTVCTFCKHPYITPCHGENAACMNAKWVRERAAA